jgi:hypothetical protein
MPNEPEMTGLASESERQAAVEQLVTRLPETDVRRLTLVATEPADWGLGATKTQIDALTRWVRLPGRRLRLIGHRFDRMDARCTRLSTWRRSWSHLVEAWHPADLEGRPIPAWMLVGDRMIEWHSDDPPRGTLTLGVLAVRRAEQQTDALLQRCEPAWPMVTLGL